MKYQLTDNKLSGYDIEVIKFVTQFQIRAMEQALIHHYNPKYNSSLPVLFNKFWYYIDIDNKNNVLVVKINGDIKNFSSLLKASFYTGVSDNYIRNVCNCTTSIYVYSAVLEKDVHFVVKFRPQIVSITKVRHGLKGFDLIILPKRVVSVLDSN